LLARRSVERRTRLQQSQQSQQPQQDQR
jgi:hypothetical protein